MRCLLLCTVGYKACLDDEQHVICVRKLVLYSPISLSLASTFPACMQIQGALLSRSDEVAASLILCCGELINSPLTRFRVVSRAVITAFGSYVETLWAGDSEDTQCLSEMTQSSERLQAALESLVQPQDILLQQAHSFVVALLPALCDVRVSTYMTIFLVT